MKYLIIMGFLVISPVLFSQNEKTLWVETEGVVAQGNISFESIPELFVGQEYFFTIIINNKQDIEIKSENLKVILNESTKKGTGGLGFKITPIDTGECKIYVSMGNSGKRTASLVLKTFHASEYSKPPVFIEGIRSGETITKLTENAELSCKYDPSLGIFDSYMIKSWQAKLGDKDFSGSGTKLTKEFIEALNNSSKEVLEITVQLDKNKTGFKSSEAVFIVK